MPNRAEQYRQLARECLKLPPGQARPLLDMAKEWERFVEQQNHASDLRKQQ